MKRASGELGEGGRVCLCCGKPIVLEGEKVKSSSALGIKATSAFFKLYECVPWCQSCLIEMYKAQYNIYHDYRLAMFYLCKMIDFPYLENYVDTDQETIEDIFRKYFRSSRALAPGKVQQGFMGGVYLSEREMPLFVEAEVIPPGDFLEINIPDPDSEKNKDRELYEKWGRNKRYSKEDYTDLEEIYKNLTGQNGIILDEKTGRVVDKVTEIAVIEAAQNLLMSRKYRAEGNAENAKKYYELYDKALGSQLLRGKDLKDKQAGDILIQDIVKHCETEGFIEPWDKQIKYPHRLDVVDQVLLHIMNYVGKLTADIFNIHVSKLDKVPKEYKLKPGNDQFPDEETEFDKSFDRAMEDIMDFKARQHISDDESDEDSADLDDDNDTDASLFGEDGD